MSLALLITQSVAAPARAQSMVLRLPRTSQRASATQRIGLTDIIVTYHRPLVAGRKIWDGAVPFNQMWRAGANENTTIEFTDRVTIEGLPLAKGVYGLHMIPGPDAWIVAFSINSGSWGSFSYDRAEDALRITVKPKTGAFQEALTYSFDDVEPNSALVTMSWEKLAVAFQVAVTEETNLQNIREALRGLQQYTWISWNDAALYCLTSRVNYEEAVRWADRSIQLEERFENLTTKRDLLEALNRTADAAAAQSRAMEVGTPAQIYFYGRQLQAQNRPTEALDIFRAAARRFPDDWVGHVAQGRVYSAVGDFPKAIQEIKAAQAAGVAAPQKQNVESLLKRLQAGQDINK